ncbi:hypothetical protein BKA01_007493 [Pseudonocardia eucalypti]|nr:hypothetical protein [Pseudonocardia eucalypti]
MDINDITAPDPAGPPAPPPARGWRRLYAERVLQADQGADLDFL